MVAKIREDGVNTGSAHIYKLDLLSLESVTSCANEIKKDFNTINILVNNG